MMEKAYRLLILALALVCLSCSPVYLDPAAEEIVPQELSEGGELPQTGTILHLNLNYSSATKFEPRFVAKMYRYRVLIDGELYSYGVYDNSGCDCIVDIPLMANDSHAPKTITAEGSASLDYSGEEKWEEWHGLFEAAQACLPEGEPAQYDCQRGARIVVKIDGRMLYFDLEENGTAECLRRLLYTQELSARVQVNDDGIVFDWQSEEDLLYLLRASIPPNHCSKGDALKEGQLYFHDYGFGISTRDSDFGSYFSTAGTVCPESRKDLPALSRKAASLPEGLYYTEATLSVAAPSSNTENNP